MYQNSNNTSHENNRSNGSNSVCDQLSDGNQIRSPTWDPPIHPPVPPVGPQVSLPGTSPFSSYYGYPWSWPPNPYQWMQQPQHRFQGHTNQWQPQPTDVPGSRSGAMVDIGQSHSSLAPPPTDTATTRSGATMHDVRDIEESGRSTGSEKMLSEM